MRNVEECNLKGKSAASKIKHVNIHVKTVSFCSFWGCPNADLKSPYMFVFIQKQYRKSFAFLILTILALFARDICNFLKRQAIFYFVLLFLNVCNENFHVSHMCISQNVKGVLMWNSRHYFHVKTKILVDFQICISMSLIL